MDIGENEKHSKSDVVLLCNVPDCYEEAVWRTENGELLCPKHLADLKADELMY